MLANMVRPSQQEIVLGRLRGRIRRLFGVGAGIRVEMRGERGDARNVRFNFSLGGHPWEKISHHKITRNPIPQRGILPPPNKLYPAIAPRRVRMTASAARERSPDAKDETKLVSNRTCTNSTHPIPLIKVLRSFFKSDRLPVPPVPPRPQCHWAKFASNVVTRSASPDTAADSRVS